MSSKTGSDGQAPATLAVPLSGLLSLAELELHFLRFDSRAGNSYSLRWITRNQGTPPGWKPAAKTSSFPLTQWTQRAPPPHPAAWHRRWTPKPPRSLNRRRHRFRPALAIFAG